MKPLSAASDLEPLHFANNLECSSVSEGSLNFNPDFSCTYQNLLGQTTWHFTLFHLKKSVFLLFSIMLQIHSSPTHFLNLRELYIIMAKTVYKKSTLSLLRTHTKTRRKTMRVYLFSWKRMSKQN